MHARMTAGLGSTAELSTSFATSTSQMPQLPDRQPVGMYTLQRAATCRQARHAGLLGHRTGCTSACMRCGVLCEGRAMATHSWYDVAPLGTGHLLLLTAVVSRADLPRSGIIIS